jgi:hypothetical protein
MEGSGLMIELQTSMEYEGYRAPNIDGIRRLCEYSNRDVRICGTSRVISPLFRQESTNEWSYNNLETIL